MSVHTKDGCQFAVIAPAGFRILSAIDQIAVWDQLEVTITSGTDGTHGTAATPGASDPHYRGEAYDIRTHDLPDKLAFLVKLQSTLGPKFYAFIEYPGQAIEHIHVQLRNGESFA